MNTTISPHVRILALVGVLAVAALLVGTQLVARGVLLSDEPDTSAPNDVNAAAVTKKVQPAAKKAAAKAQTAVKAKKPTKAAATKPKAKAARATAKAPAKKAPRLKTRGLPVPVARELSRREVVVVSLFAPDAPLDRMALAEARAGARNARAGFVALNVLQERPGRALTAKLGVVDPPAVLVYRKPAELVLQLDGFADAATVAQAAANARP